MLRFIFLLALSTPVFAAEEMRLSLILDEGSDWYEGCRRFQELVATRTAGEMQVRIIINAQLSGNSQATELEMLSTGGLEASLQSSILLTNVVSEMRAFTEPWRFISHDEAETFADGPEGQLLLTRLESSGIVGLAWGTNGFRQLTNNRHAVRAPVDLQGLRVRVADSPQFIEFFRLLGADPVTMNFGELITALQTGAVDAQENPLSVIWSQRLYDVQEHLTIWNATYDPIALCVNAAWFTGLGAPLQDTLRECAREAMQHERTFSRAREGELLDQLKQHMQVAELSSAEVESFRGALKPAAAASLPAPNATPPGPRRLLILLPMLAVLFILALSFIAVTALVLRRRP